jgi:glycosyltransferase involved in cell wall biosynthesis
MSDKLKIYALLTTIKTLVPSSGDKINEINLYKAMSTFADVYYNNQKFESEKENEGYCIKDLPISPPNRDYDVCYIRNNRKIFNDIKQKKLWVGSPYRQEIFSTDAGIVTFTRQWKEQLRDFNKNFIPGLYEEGICVPKNILYFPQSISLEDFNPNLKNHPKTINYKDVLKADFVIAQFGRMAKGCYPYSLLTILPKLRKRFPEKSIKFIYAGTSSQIKIGISNEISFIGGIDYCDMPYVISACDVVSSNYRTDTANWGGCRHVLESMACGKPILTGDFSVRKEQLGSDYELFWNWEPNSGRISEKAEEQMLSHLSNLIENPKYGEEIGNRLIKRSLKYSHENIGKIIKKELNQVL